jgi:hypothetical protein
MGLNPASMKMFGIRQYCPQGDDRSERELTCLLTAIIMGNENCSGTVFDLESAWE